MRNHMFIGLGGQGARSLAELRKVMEARHRDRARLEAAGVKWDFLSIDSGGDVWRDNRQWSYFGKDLSLAQNQLLRLQSDGLGNSVEALALSPDIAPWIGSTENIRRFIGGDSGNGVPGANQRRRFGRLLFAASADAVRHAIVFDKVQRMLEGAQNTCWFHIFASLAGGTGSGCIVDLITMLRQEYPNADPSTGFPIYLYLYLTDSDGAAADVGYFYQNQFAALRDLNALMVGRLRPVLLGAQQQGRAFTGGTAINAAIISTNLNSGSRNVPLPTQIKITAEAVFERIFTFDTGHLGAQQQQSLTFEDIIGTFPGEPLQNSERGYRFGALGMRKWEVPNEKLEELIGLEIACSGLSQMLFNNWQPSAGFVPSARPTDNGQISVLVESLSAVVRNRLIRREAGLTERSNLSRELAELEKGAKKKELTLEDVEAEVDRYVRDEFGGEGLQKFIASFSLSRTAAADSIIVELDRVLTKAWADSTSPVALREAIEAIDHLTAKLRDELSSSVDHVSKELRDQRRAKRRLEWDKLTFLSRPLKRNSLIGAHFRDLEIGALYKFDKAAQVEDDEFLRVLTARLGTLRAAYQTASSVLSDLMERLRKDAGKIESELLALQSQPGANQYEFSKTALDEFRAFLRKDRESQNIASHEMRGVVAGDENGRTLQHFRGREEQCKEQLDDALRNAGVDAAKRFHLHLTSSNAVPHVLGASLLDRLEKKFSGDPKGLEQAARQFVGLAASCCANAPQMQPSVILRDGLPAMPRRILLVGVPQGAFAATMRQAFQDALPAGGNFIFDTYVHEEPSQIRLLVCDYWMAARFAQVAHGLAPRYSTAGGGGGMHVKYFCNIDPEGESDKRPDLFLPDPTTRRQSLHAQLWLGCHLSPPLIKEDHHGVTLFERTDPGVRTAERIGQDIPSVVAGADIGLMQRVSSLVSLGLSEIGPAERANLQNAVEKADAEKAHQFGDTSPEYRAWGQLRIEIHRLAGI